MTFFRDRSIGIKVLIPPLILIAALAVVSLLAVYGIDRQHEALTAVNDLALDKITLVDEFSVLSEQVQSDVFRIFVLRSMALPAAEIQPVHARLEQGLSDLGVIYGEILTRWPLDPTERAFLERMKTPLDAFSAQARQAALVVTDNPSFGVLLVRSSTVPFAEFRGVLAEFLNYQQAKIVSATTAANQAADQARNLLLAVALVTALIATLAAVLISARAISRPVQAITAMMGRLADGDLAIELHGAERQDEIGAMARAVAVFRDNAIEQARLDRELRASEERYRLLFHHSPAGVLHYDTQLHITDCNERLATILQSTRQKLIGLDMTRLNDQSVLPALRQALAEEEGFYEGLYAATTGPARVWVAFRTAPLFDQQGQVTGGMGLVEDITERKRAEEAQMERVRLTTLAADVGNALTHGDALAGTLQQCAECMVQHLDLAFARIWTLDPTETMLELQTSAGIYTHTDGQHRRIPVGERKIGLIAQERRPHLTNQVIGDPYIPDQAWAQREGLVAFAGYPLIAEGRLVGVMAMFARHPLTDLAFEAMAPIVDSIALGIQQRRSKEALRAQEEYYRALIENTSDAISLMGEQGTIQYLSPSTERVAGHTLAERVGKDGLELVHPDDLEYLHARISELRKMPGGSLGMEYRLRHKDGTWRRIEATATNLLHNPNVRGIVTNFRDITERKQAEEALRKAHDDLARSNTDLERFAYVASHDLQEPLRMVASFVQLLGERYRGQLDADADEFIGFAVDGAKRMQTLINDLLEYSRVGTRAAPPQPIDANVALEDALWNLDLAISDAGATVTHDPLPTVLADPTQLTQLFQNLIGNAIKFRGSDPPVVHVSAQLRSADFGFRNEAQSPQSETCTPQWLFSVRDNGIGIDPKDHDRIFGIFQRLHTREAYAGTGIGLAVCQRIVERHGGRIWVESQVGQGTTFFFTLPTAT